MSTLEIWITIIGMCLLTLLTRAGFLLLPNRYQLPPRVQRALRYAPGCALMALVVPDLLLSQGGASPATLDLSLNNARLIAGLIALSVFFYKRNMLLMITVGMLSFTALRLMQ